MSLSTTSPMSDEERKLIEYRNQTNFRSVKRADSSVTQILETSVYSVIYNYDEMSGKWEKQKQEGPLFVVQRDKTPEWSLYMLNRQGLKNPAIALVPGEMKMTVIDQGMLQVARRGDKQRIGIWFSEGAEAVERFKRTVLGICGEPSKRPDLPNMASSPAPTNPQPGASEDGLSRLFAGLMKSPPVQSPPVQAAVPAPPTQTTTITTTTVSTTSQPILTANPAPPPPGPIPVPTQADPTSTHANLPISPPPPPPPPQVQSPPGQTADDLLMSILGLAPPTVSPQPPQPQQQQQQVSPLPTVGIPTGPPIQNMPPVLYPSAPGTQQFPNQPFPPHPQFQQFPPPPAHGSHPHQSPYLQNRPTPPPGQMQGQFSPVNQNQQPRYHKIGDATFAQTAAIASTLSPNPPNAMLSPNQESSSASSPAISFHTPSGTSTPNGYRTNQESRNVIVESVVDGIQKRERDEGLKVAGMGIGKEDRKLEFRRRITDLILSDERFVDELWESYLDRMSRAAQGG